MDSQAWLKTSKPFAARTSGGSEASTPGSSTPRSARSMGLTIPVFTSISRRSKMAIPVHSLAVPKVVGQAMCGLSFPGTGTAFPIGAFT